MLIERVHVSRDRGSIGSMHDAQIATMDEQQLRKLAAELIEKHAARIRRSAARPKRSSAITGSCTAARSRSIS